MTALRRKLLRDLVHLRAQVAAIALVVASGVMTFVAMRSVYDSLVESRAAYYELYRFADVFAQIERAPDPVADEIAAIPGVAAVDTRVVADVTLDVPGLAEPATGRLVSIPEDRPPTLNLLHLQRGRWIAPDGRDEVLASAAFAEANGLEPGDELGAVLNGRWRRLRIVGIAISPEYVYEIRGAGDIFPDNRRFGVLWLGRDELAAAFDLESAFNDIAVALGPGASEPAVIEALDRVLAPYGGLGAYGREDQLSDRFLSSEIEQNEVTSTIVPAIFLGVAAFLLNIVLSRLVATQRDQIAVLKAFGYTDFQVGAHYLGFALAAVIAGAALGTALGFWLGSELTQIYARFYRFPVLHYAAGPSVVAVAVAINIAAALVGAYAAVRRAVALPPAEAMRPEAPARYRPGLVERLGLGRLLSPVGRMIVRSLERRPARALLTLLGIGLAVAILVVGRYFSDAIDHTIRVAFRTAQRQDVTLIFETPLPTSARYELARLPGVLRVEPFRSVPVRLRHGHLTSRTALIGRPTDAQLQRLVDREGDIARLGAGGLLLTTTLAETLDVAPGETVTVEVLEGARPVRRVLVNGTIDELTGTAAYMRIDAVYRLLRERPTMSGAHLRIDPLAEAGLYDRLVGLPAVSGITIREASLASFEETLAESLLISTTVLSILAIVIAFGIVYNNARIALSERGRELATLRVLGFYRSEAARVLLGEQALLTALALPVGFVLGYFGVVAVAAAAASELYRLPVVVGAGSYVFAAAVVVVAAVLSGLAVRRRIDRMDLIEVLKTRE